jgi:hypothetical protein
LDPAARFGPGELVKIVQTVVANDRPQIADVSFSAFGVAQEFAGEFMARDRFALPPPLRTESSQAGVGPGAVEVQHVGASGVTNCLKGGHVDWSGFCGDRRPPFSRGMLSVERIALN